MTAGNSSRRAGKRYDGCLIIEVPHEPKPEMPGFHRIRIGCEKVIAGKSHTLKHIVIGDKQTCSFDSEG
jgi:hypothetical protein